MGGNLGPDVLDWGGVTWVLMFWTGEGGGGNLGPDVLDWGGGWSNLGPDVLDWGGGWG